MELVKVDAQEYGLTEELAKNIKDQFSPMLNKMVELENEFNEVMSLPIDDIETSKRAKELKQKYVKVRTGTSEIHKQQKAFFLNGGRFVDGWKNAQIFASQGKEEKLEYIEKYAENIEKERVEKIHNERVDMIRPYVDDVTTLYLGTMEDDVWDAYYFAKKSGYENRMEAQRKAEEERRQIEAKLKLGSERKLHIQEEGLWGLLYDEEKAMDFSVMTELFYNRLLNDLELRNKAKEEESNRIRMENQKLAEQKAKAEAESKKLKAEIEAKEKEFRDAESLKQLEEEKARKEAIKLAKAPIKKQLKSWVDSFDLPNPPQHDMTVDIILKFNSFKSWALTQIDNL